MSLLDKACPFLNERFSFTQMDDAWCGSPYNPNPGDGSFFRVVLPWSLPEQEQFPIKGCVNQGYHLWIKCNSVDRRICSAGTSPGDYKFNSVNELKSNFVKIRSPPRDTNPLHLVPRFIRESFKLLQ